MRHHGIIMMTQNTDFYPTLPLRPEIYSLTDLCMAAAETMNK